MKSLLVAIIAAMLISGAARAQTPDACALPAYLLFGDTVLTRVAAEAKERKTLDILVMGTGSSLLPGPGGAAKSYPGQLELALRRRLPALSVNVRSDTKSRQTAAEMSHNFEKLIRDFHPSLVIWQTGTFDAMRGIDTDDFRSVLDAGVETLKAGGADVVLMNMQYSPRTESIIPVEPYADAMRVAAREHGALLFDRFGIMRHWNDSGTFDLNAGSKDPAMAQQVHECLGRALATQVIDAARLSPAETKTTQ